MNIITLYTLYKKWMEENHADTPAAQKWFYGNVFHSEFNVGFKPPKSDRCNLCDKIKIELTSLLETAGKEHICELKTQQS